MKMAGLLILRSSGDPSKPALSPATGSPLADCLIWTRSPSRIYHLARSDSDRTLCHLDYQPWVEAGWLINSIDEELPRDAGRFPCMHCTRARKRRYL